MVLRTVPLLSGCKDPCNSRSESGTLQVERGIRSVELRRGTVYDDSSSSHWIDGLGRPWKVRKEPNKERDVRKKRYRLLKVDL